MTIENLDLRLSELFEELETEVVNGLLLIR